jgi:hypothetical protein
MYICSMKVHFCSIQPKVDSGRRLVRLLDPRTAMVAETCCKWWLMNCGAQEDGMGEAGRAED